MLIKFEKNTDFRYLEYNLIFVTQEFFFMAMGKNLSHASNRSHT